MAIKQTIPCPSIIINTREGKKIGKKEMATRMGVSRRQYYEIEAGRMTWAELNALTQQLGLRILILPQEFL